VQWSLALRKVDAQKLCHAEAPSSQLEVDSPLADPLAKHRSAEAPSSFRVPKIAHQKPNASNSIMDGPWHLPGNYRWHCAMPRRCRECLRAVLPPARKVIGQHGIASSEDEPSAKGPDASLPRPAQPRPLFASKKCMRARGSAQIHRSACCEVVNDPHADRFLQPQCGGRQRLWRSLIQAYQRNSAVICAGSLVSRSLACFNTG